MPALLTSSSSPSPGPTLLLPAALTELLPGLVKVLVEQASKLPCVRCERGGGGALKKSGNNSAFPVLVDLLGGYTAAGDGRGG